MVSARKAGHDQPMHLTCHISLSRVAANGAAPPCAEASPVTSVFRRAQGRGCSRTGPATADSESPMKVADVVRLKPDTTEISYHHDSSMNIVETL